MKNFLEKPTALDQNVQEAIIAMLARGNYITTACLASGITYRGFRQWQKRWEEGDPDAQRFDAFFRAIDRAIGTGEDVALGTLRQGEQGWQAQAWFLERRFPQRWGKKDRTPVPPRPAKPLDQMTSEELDEHERKLGAGKDRG